MTNYKLVPVEPTEEMSDAAERAWCDFTAKTFADIYRAMLNAAPQPVAPAEQEPVAYLNDNSDLVVWPIRKHMYPDHYPVYTHAAPCKRCEELEWEKSNATRWFNEANDKLAALEAKLQRAEKVVCAAENLAKQKGRYNTEIAYGFLTSAIQEYQKEVK